MSPIRLQQRLFQGILACNESSRLRNKLKKKANVRNEKKKAKEISRMRKMYRGPARITERG